MKDGQEPGEYARAGEAASDVYDVAVLGGGLAGMTLSLELQKAHPSIRIVVVEKREHPVSEATHKVGESTVEIAAHYLRDILELDEHLQTRQLRKFGLRMFFSADGNRDIARRVELGPTVFPPLCTYQLDRGRLENMLGDELIRRGIPFLDGSKVREVSLRPQEEYHTVRILHDGREREVRARWIVDASGRNTLLQRQLGLAKEVGHHANAAWFRIDIAIDVKQWTTDPGWHSRVTEGDRALSTNHLMGPGYWVWLIRLASGSTSVGIVTDASIHSFDEINLFERALDWLYRHEPQCAQVVERHRDRIQDFRVMKDYSYGCEQVFSDERWCLTGEAGVALDPLYSPGSDLIAISNGLISELISRDLRGEDIRARAALHNRLFLSLTEIWLNIYERQYSLMDNAQVMVTKIIWDTAFYWGVFGLLYFHDAFANISDSPGVAANLSLISALSNRMQAFFREWHAIDRTRLADTFVNIYSEHDFMVKLHAGMAAGLSAAKVGAQFAANVRLFEEIAGQIICTVIEAYADDFEHEDVLEQIQRWQMEPYISELIARNRREARTNSISRSWIAIGQRSMREVMA